MSYKNVFHGDSTFSSESQLLPFIEFLFCMAAVAVSFSKQENIAIPLASIFVSNPCSIHIQLASDVNKSLISFQTASICNDSVIHYPRWRLGIWITQSIYGPNMDSWSQLIIFILSWATFPYSAACALVQSSALLICTLVRSELLVSKIRVIIQQCKLGNVQDRLWKPKSYWDWFILQSAWRLSPAWIGVENQTRTF